ncbi:MAG: D-glycero-beta-D-manno-heptose-7-phosphate kinase [Ignavibacteria bacterium]|nr:MAG: D-glycero-beta-D-manno-heptose-7-phosphate kinase [Ignavibacteria bacterium]
MINVSLERLNELKKNFENKNIAVIGDMMLDAYFWGDTKRISPEAPVPVIEIDEEFFRFGGAANVALNLSTLKANPFPFGIIGDDNDGEIFKKLMNDANINPEGIICDSSRPTTSKARVIAANQHVVRIDKESKAEINEETEKKLLDSFMNIVDNLDAVILQDYNKGVLTKNLIKSVIDVCNQKDIIVTVDPKFLNFFEYKNVTVFKPNKKETEDAFGTKIMNDDDLENLGKELKRKLNSKYVLLTLGEKGIALFGNGEDIKRIPTKARKVADVSGAGDTVISTLTVALSAGAEIEEASYLANYAGGLVCEEVGIVPIDIDKLFLSVEKDLK